MTLNFSFIENNGKEAVTVFLDGDLKVASNEHPNWDAIKAGVLRAAGGGSADGLSDLFDTEKAVSDKFQQYSERVSVKDGTVYFDGDPQAGVLVDHIVRALNDGTEDFGPLVLFMENVKTNPSERSREQLYQWLEASNRSSASGGFTIDERGYILGYKGVAVVDEDKGLYTSISSGQAIVNGQVHNGRIPQTFGDVVEMPRSQVSDDPNVHCHTGLHVGVWEYASRFAQGAVLQVAFNPRDVVSVPNDHSAQKLRTCRYEVEDVLDAPLNKAVQVDYPVEEDFEEYDEDDDDLGEFDAGVAEDIANEADRSSFFDQLASVSAVVANDKFGLPNGKHLQFDVNTLNKVENITEQVRAVVKDELEKQQKRRPTADNHLKQKRGPGGRFLPKS